MTIIPAIKMLVKSNLLADIIVGWVKEDELEHLEIEEDNPIEFNHENYTVSITWDFVTVVDNKNNNVVDCTDNFKKIIKFFNEQGV